MKDIAARELIGHNILAVERFWDSTFWMIEFTVLRPTAYGPFHECLALLHRTVAGIAFCLLCFPPSLSNRQETAKKNGFWRLKTAE